MPQQILLPRSKSIVIRCLIIHYLRTGELLPVFEDDPNDIKIVYNALEKIEANKLTSHPLVSERSRAALLTTIDVEDCGAAYRFLMAVLAATPGKWLLTGTPRLLERPILPLVNFLNENGAKIQRAESGWEIEGKDLIIDNIDNIETDQTSQYASALLMLNSRVSWLKPTAILNSQFSILNFHPYIRMTQTLLQTPPTTYRSPHTAHLSPLFYSDWSAAIFWIAKALLTPDAHYLLKNLHFDNLQGDAAIVPWFEKWGVVFVETQQGIEVCHTHHVDIPAQTIDVAPTPDIAMILAVLSVCYPFELTLTGLKNLNLKESNRLDIMVKELLRFTTVEKHTEDAITIYKRRKELPKKFYFDSYNDHRFVMAWSLFSIFGEVKIKNAECVAKSYPKFLCQEK